jgi:hypothetical protein
MKGWRGPWAHRVYKSYTFVQSRAQNPPSSFVSWNIQVRRSVHGTEKSLGIDRIRNIGIIAHIDAVSQAAKETFYVCLFSHQGKTTTTERMLYYSGTTNRIGGKHK